MRIPRLLGLLLILAFIASGCGGGSGGGGQESGGGGGGSEARPASTGLQPDRTTQARASERWLT